jgi:molybdopterin biosynthesis enzyme
MVDGYAVICADGPGKVCGGHARARMIGTSMFMLLFAFAQYPVVGDLKAGSSASAALSSGSVAYVTTGGPIPPGADGVVKVRHCTEP